MRVGMENIVVKFHCNRMRKKNVVTKQLFAPNFFENVL